VIPVIVIEKEIVITGNRIRKTEIEEKSEGKPTEEKTRITEGSIDQESLIRRIKQRIVIEKSILRMKGVILPAPEIESTPLQKVIRLLKNKRNNQK